MNCFLFDIDGTLADLSHRLHHIQKQPKDWDAFFAAVADDAPIEHVIAFARTLWAGGAKLVFVSGRNEVCRLATVNWLRRYGLPSGPLLMRGADDRRPDDVVKTEMLPLILAYGYTPVMAFEDRDRVVAAWRAHGIPCAQVAPGAF